MSEKVARRYAQALLEVSGESRKMAAVHRDLNVIAGALEHSSDLARFLANPVIPSQKCQDVLKDLFLGKIDALTCKFLLFLAEKRRLDHLRTICTVFDSLYAETRGVMKTRWTTSVELAEADTQAIAQHLKTKFQKDIEIEHNVDEAIWGGIKIQTGDTVHDYSLAAQLAKFKQAFINV